MMIFSSSKVFFVLIVSFCVVEATLTPGGTVSVDCGSTQTFTCNAPGVDIGWNIAGLSGINIPGPFLARREAMGNSRLTSNDTGGVSQSTVSVITISGFSISDNGGIIQCVNMRTNSSEGMATISVDLLPTTVTATVESCNVILQWTQPSEPNDITASVSCTPPSPGCAECTTSPCTITGLSPSTEYVFTVTLNSGLCRDNMNVATARTMDSCVPTEMPSTNTSNEISYPTCTSQSALLTAGIIPSVVLLLANVVTGVVVFLITRHCYKKASQRSSPSKGEDVYEQVEGPKTCEDIVMTDSPAYGPVK